MLVKDKMTPHPITVAPTISISEAFSIMRDHGISRLPVMQKGKLLGIVTKNGLQRVTPSDATSLSVFELNYLLGKLTVKDAMTPNPITIQEDDYLEHAAVLMRQHDIGALPVMHGKFLVGIITETDIFDAFIDMLGARFPGVRLTVRMPNKAGVGAEMFSVISSFGVNVQHVVLNNSGDTAEMVLRLDTQDAAAVKKALHEKGYGVE